MIRPTNQKSLVNLILKGIAIAMGIAVVVLQLLGAAPLTTTVTLLGLGLFCLALSSLQTRSS
jgi:hypothetical protein